jgi:hypothetical protein
MKNNRVFIFNNKFTYYIVITTLGIKLTAHLESQSVKTNHIHVIILYPAFTSIYFMYPN